MVDQQECHLGDLVYWKVAPDEPAHGYISLVALKQYGPGPFTVTHLEEGVFGTLATLVAPETSGAFQEFTKFFTKTQPEDYEEICENYLTRGLTSFRRK